MAYFSNRTEGDCYESAVCSKCAHYNKKEPCPVLGIHLFNNYDQMKDEKIKNILEMLIPSAEEGTGNQKCNMFIKTDKDDRQIDMFGEV